MELLPFSALVYVIQGNTFSALCTVARSTECNIILILKCIFMCVCVCVCVCMHVCMYVCMYVYSSSSS